jgi:hypothetical protein
VVMVAPSPCAEVVAVVVKVRSFARTNAISRAVPCELMVFSLPVGGAELDSLGEPPDVLPVQLDVTGP